MEEEELTKAAEAAKIKISFFIVCFFLLINGENIILNLTKWRSVGTL